MKSNQAIHIVAILLGLSAVHATPLEPIQKREIDPQFSPFAQCMQTKIPGYPFADKPSSQQASECYDTIGGAAATRAQLQAAATTDDGSNSTELQSRGILERVMRAGAELAIDHKPFCDGTKVHDNFVWVTEIRDNAVSTCEELMRQIHDEGIKEDGGVGFLVKQLTNGNDKQGHQLKGGRKVTATFLLNFIPPAKAAVETIKEIASGVDELCQHALSKIATKDVGCSAEIDYFVPSKAKSFTGTGAIGGFLEMVWDKATDGAVANIAVDFSNDE